METVVDDEFIFCFVPIKIRVHLVYRVSFNSTPCNYTLQTYPLARYSTIIKGDLPTEPFQKCKSGNITKANIAEKPFR